MHTQIIQFSCSARQGERMFVPDLKKEVYGQGTKTAIRKVDVQSL